MPASSRPLAEKEWYFRWFRPDLAVGVASGATRRTSPCTRGTTAYGPSPGWSRTATSPPTRTRSNELPLVLVTSSWVKETYVRDGIAADCIEVLPVGVDTEAFRPRPPDDVRVAAVREALGVAPRTLLVLTVGGDGVSKGAREVMRALARIDRAAPDWRYVCKVWPQPRTQAQNADDLRLAAALGIERKVAYATSVASRDFMPYLLAACDVYAAPSRLEGFGMPHMEAAACAKPVLAVDAMAFRDTLVHGETALLAGVAREIRVAEAVLGEAEGFPEGRCVTFAEHKTAACRADVGDVARHLLRLLEDGGLRRRLGRAGRARAVERFHYRTVAARFVGAGARAAGHPVTRPREAAPHGGDESFHEARAAALAVLRHNAVGPCPGAAAGRGLGLPRALHPRPDGRVPGDPRQR
jgi:starch synthase